MWFAANAALFGMHPAPWHLAKIIVHAVAVMLCFPSRNCLRRGRRRAAGGSDVRRHADARRRGGVRQRDPEPLSTVFELGALRFLIGRKPGWSRELFSALILYACATLTHESAILFPLIIFAYGYLRSGSVRSAADLARASARHSWSCLRICARG